MQTNLKPKLIYRRLLGISVSALAVFVLGFAILPVLALESSASAVGSELDLRWLPISLTLDPDVAASEEYEESSGASGSRIGDLGHGDILFSDLIPTSRDNNVASAASGNVGTLKVVKKTIGIETTGKYYTVYLSTNSSSSSLDYNIAATNLSIPSIGSSFSSPSVFSSSAWGFAIPGIEDTRIENAPTFASSSLYNSAATSSSVEGLTYNTHQNLYSQVTFSPIPNFSSAQQIWKAETDNGYGFGGEHGDSNNTFDIYYGIMVDTGVVSGVYNNNIVYTALASAADLDLVSENLAATTSYGVSGDNQTLIFELNQNLDARELTTSSFKVYLVKHSDMVAAEYDINDLNPAKMAAITNPSNASSSQCATTSILASENNVTLTCTLPSPNETADETADGTTAAGQNGRFDFWVYLPDYGLNWVSKAFTGDDSGDLEDDTREAFAYVGLQSRYKDYENNELVLKPYITEMQEMRNIYCQNTPSYSSSALTYNLADTRDTNSYNVRKLGNDCWMVSDLLFVGTSINTDTTDTDTNKTLSYTDMTSVGGSYTVAQRHAGNNLDNNPTVWYNYAAATAMTVLGESNNNEANDSICPKNWKLPSRAEATAATNYTTAFSPARSRFIFRDGSMTSYQTDSQYSGSYWTAAASNETCRYSLYYVDGNFGITGSGTVPGYQNGRDYGAHIRCVARN